MNDDEDDYLTFSEIKEEYPKAAKNWNWTAKMFYYWSTGGLLKKRYNYSIRVNEYSRKSLHTLIDIINGNLDNLRIDP